MMSFLSGIAFGLLLGLAVALDVKKEVAEAVKAAKGDGDERTDHRSA
jgi:hypothetical protein